MATGIKTKTNAIRYSVDCLPVQSVLKVPLHSKLHHTAHPSPKTVHFTNSSKFTKSICACATPDRFSKRTGRKSSIETHRSKLDLVDLDVRFDPDDHRRESEPFCELEFEEHANWSDWLEYISQIESIENRVESMKTELDDLVKSEQFSEAAQLRSKLDLCNEHNLTLKIQKKLDEAIKSEDFQLAAKLRDEGLIGLNGWWIARGKDDPQGTLVYIHRGFSHYSGRAISVSDIALANSKRESSILMSFFSDELDVFHSLSNVVLEVYLREDINESIFHQSCIWRIPSIVEQDAEAKLVDVSEESSEFDVECEYDEDGYVRVATITHKSSNENNFNERMKEIVDVEHHRVTSEELVEDPEDDFQFRIAGDIRWWDRNRFILTTREEPQIEDSDSDEFEFVSSTLETIDQNESKSRTPTSFQTAIERILTKSDRPQFFEDMSKIIQDSLLSSLQDLTDKRNHQLERETMFSRLPTDVESSDPFSGFYVGSFRPHGMELLHLSRHREEGTNREFVEARKVTGDANVPAGEVSFWAYIGRESRSSFVGRYPEELGIQSIYCGKGKIARKGFTDPRWVDGELLCFEKWSSMAGGNDLGFVWSVPNARKFLILLYRVRLPEY
eukprot:g3068.t1